MRRHSFCGKSKHVMTMRGLSFAMTAILIAILPVTANSEEFFVEEVQEEIANISSIEDSYEENISLTEDTEIVMNDELIDDLSIFEEDNLLNEDEVEETGDNRQYEFQEFSEIEVSESANEAETDLIALEETSKPEDCEENKYSGECGVEEGTVFWELDAEGTLHLYGQGEMANWDSPIEVPWAHCSDMIIKLDVQDGITGIGSYSFSGCSSLTTARIG